MTLRFVKIEVSSAGFALAVNYSILLSRLVYLANIRFHWVIDAAEEPEPGAHANDDVTTQRNRKRVPGP